MIKENQKLLNRIQVVLDAVVIIMSYGLSWYIRFRSGFFELDPWYLSLREYMRLLIYLVPGYLLLYYIFQLYTPKRVEGRRLEVWHIFQANTIGLMTLSLAFFLTKLSAYYSRWVIFIFFFVNIVAEVLVRNIVRIVLRNARKKGYNQKHMILVGYSRAAEQYIDRIKANPEWGYSIRGILDDHQPRGCLLYTSDAADDISRCR
ncbi:MAG: undecaprenyl-phosphate glucose phosphotransferase, partial [Candidatus Ruminococcus intestinipullorum]|nr:undecaprenyl-phosphate glucose phosphotransferase [Candidatus Ruminococcus intestinipullorum]